MTKASGKTRKPREDGVRTREAILVAAGAEFAKNGFELASMREICRAAQCNCALAARYFENKETLYRTVAQRLFGELGRPMAEVADKAKDAKSWREAVREWVDDFLFMTIPTSEPQKLCRGLFRNEVVRPTKFHAEFVRKYGEPIYRSLYALVSKAERDPVKVDLWTSSIWSQISVYALADVSWQKSFRPKGVTDAEWRKTLGGFICDNIFSVLAPK